MSAVQGVPPYVQTLDKFDLIGRKVWVARASVAIDPGINSPIVQFAQVPPGTFTLGAPEFFKVSEVEAIRIVKGSWCTCLTNGPSGNLACETLTLILQDSLGNSLRKWPGNYSGDVIGTNGQTMNVTDEELFKGDDFKAWGGDGRFTFLCAADVFNKGLVQLGATLEGAVMFEIWRLKTTSRMRG
jgi:hypothetical protein